MSKKNEKHKKGIMITSSNSAYGYNSSSTIFIYQWIRLIFNIYSFIQWHFYTYL